MSSKSAPVNYDDVLVPNITTTIVNNNGTWSISSTTLIALYRDLPKAVPNYNGIKRVAVKEDGVFIYSQS